MGIDDGNAAFLSEGGDEGIVVEGVVGATKKAGSLSSSPSPELPPAPVVVGVGGASVGGARAGDEVGVPQVRPDARCARGEGVV
jgi:hypothetical protein